MAIRFLILLRGRSERMPFPSGIADLITVENSPLEPATIQEIARVIRPGGLVRLCHPQGYATRVHTEATRVIGGETRQKVRAGVITTYIVGP